MLGIIANIILNLALNGCMNGILGAAASSPKGIAIDDQRKADYIFLEAKTQELKGDRDAYYQLLDYAVRLNPADESMAVEWAPYVMQLDSIHGRGALDVVKEYVEHNPDDLYKGFYYATITGRFGLLDESIETLRSLREHFPDRDIISYRLAETLQATGDSASRIEALGIYDSMMDAGGDPLDIVGRKASIYYTMNDTASILRTADDLIRRSPRNANYNVYVGQIYQAFLDSDSALTFYDRALELDPNNGMAYYAKANFFNQRNDSVGFDRETFNALQQPDLDLEIKLAIMRDYVAKLYTDTLQQPRIAELFATLEQQHPHEATVHDMFGEYLMVVRDYERSAEQTSLSLDLEPSDLSKWARLGSLYITLKDYDKALNAVRRGRHYFPNDMVLYEMEANTLTIDGDYRGSLAVVDSALAVCDTTDISTRVALMSLRADNLYKLGEKTEALELLDQCVAMEPDDPGLLNNAAYFFACEGHELQRALRMIERSTSMDPENPTSLDTYAWVLFKLKRYDEAQKIIDHVLELSATDDEPTSAEVLEHAGDIYFMNGHPAEAVDFWRKALNEDPENTTLKKKVTHKNIYVEDL